MLLLARHRMPQKEKKKQYAEELGEQVRTRKTPASQGLVCEQRYTTAKFQRYRNTAEQQQCIVQTETQARVDKCHGGGGHLKSSLSEPDEDKGKNCCKYQTHMGTIASR